MELKKTLGQHFLTDQSVLERIVSAVDDLGPFQTVIEVGPGMGALTEYLLGLDIPNFYLIEKDDRFVVELPKKFSKLEGRIFHQDVLTFDFKEVANDQVTIVGNYPYNISNLIMFWIIENFEYVVNSVGMFQKEVAERIVAPPGGRVYGILSVLVQAYYDVEYLFDVRPECFTPPPKVMSGVIRLKRKQQDVQVKSERAFWVLVKTAFNQRRKMLRNAVKSLFDEAVLQDPIFQKRAEQLSVAEFARLTYLMN